MVDTIQTTAAAASAASTPDMAKAVLLAGFLGGILSMSFVDGMSKWQRAIAVCSGSVMAHYLSPLIAFLFKEGDYVQTIGFLIGLFGMSICAAIFRAIQNSDIWGLISRRFGRGNDI